METNVNNYLLNQLLKGCNVQMYKAEVDAIKKHLEQTNPNLVERIVAKKQSDKSKYLLCRIS